MRAISKVVYQPLNLWQTRIIKIFPGRLHDPVRCQLLTVDIIGVEGLGIPESNEIIRYDALSYSWGCPDFTASIEGNDIPLLVIVHLAEAMRHIRDEGEQQYL